jgi:hypothetical protein
MMDTVDGSGGAAAPQPCSLMLGAFVSLREIRDSCLFVLPFASFAAFA